MFASFADAGVGQYLLLAIAPPFDETTYTAENHRAFIGDVLELFGKGIGNLIYLVADNAAVNTCLANLLGIPMIGCASHRFNLACKKYLQGSEVIIQKIRCLMTTLRQVKQAGKLRTKTAFWNQSFEMKPDGRQLMKCSNFLLDFKNLLTQPMKRWLQIC